MRTKIIILGFVVAIATAFYAGLHVKQAQWDRFNLGVSQESTKQLAHSADHSFLLGVDLANAHKQTQENTLAILDSLATQKPSDNVCTCDSAWVQHINAAAANYWPATTGIHDTSASPFTPSADWRLGTRSNGEGKGGGAQLWDLLSDKRPSIDASALGFGQ